MSALLQQVLVGVLVAACALMAFWRLASVQLRLRLLGIAGNWPALRDAPWLERLRQRTRAQVTAACGGCSQAGNASTPDAASGNQTPGALRR